MKKYLKIFIIVLLVLLAIFCATIARKVIIIKKLQKNVSEYIKSTNYHVESEVSIKNGTKIKTDYYGKDDKKVIKIERNINGVITKITTYYDGEKADMFIEGPGEKSVQLNTTLSMSNELYDYFESENLMQTISTAIPAQITKIKYDEKECYMIDNYNTQSYLNGTETNKLYIDKKNRINFKNDYR